MKKKLIISALILVVLLGSAQVYAATVLNTNLIDLIKEGFASTKSHFSSELDTDTNKLSEKYKNEAGKVVTDMTENTYSELESHKDTEIARSEQELNAYLKALEKEINGVADEQVKEIKDSITKKVNQSIEKTKDQIDKEIEKQLKDKLKIKQ